MNMRFLPIAIGNQKFLISTKGRTNTPNVLPAILNGEHIDVSETFREGRFLIYNATSETTESVQ